MATRTTLGTAKAKASGTTLTLNSAACSQGDSLIVFVGCKGQTPPTSTKWGGRSLSKVGQRLNATDDFSVFCYQARRILNTDTRNIVVTWAAGTLGKVLFALKLDSPHVRDEIARNIQGSSTAPTVGPTAESDRSDSFAIGVLGSEGPSGDTAPTLAGGFTAGQRDGTTGGGPATNLTLLEGYQQLTSSVAVTLSGTGATSRTWTNMVITFRPTFSCTTDKFGNEIEVGDSVIYQGNTRAVNNVRDGQNHADLATDGWVNASEVEVAN